MVNAVPDSPALRFTVQEREEAVLRFGEASAFVETLPDIRLSFSVAYVDDGTRVQLISDEFTIQQDRDFTAVVTGTLDNPRLILIDNPPIEFADDADQAEIQFVHAATTGPETLEVIINNGAEPAATLGFGEATGIQTLPGGEDSVFTLRAPGDTTNLWSSGSFAFPSANRQLVVILDYFGPGDSSIRMLAAGETGAIRFPEEDLPAAIRLANMIPDRGPLDISVAGNTLAENLSFTGVTDHVQLAPGELAVQATPTGQPGRLVFEGAFQVARGQFQTLTLSGLDTDNSAAVSEDNNRRLPLGATLSVTHASPSANPEGLDVYILAQDESVANRSPDARLEFLDTGTLLTSPGTYDLVLTIAGTDDIVFDAQRIDLSGSGIYKIFVRDTSGGGTPIEVTLEDDFLN